MNAMADFAAVARAEVKRAKAEGWYSATWGTTERQKANGSKGSRPQRNRAAPVLDRLVVAVGNGAELSADIARAMNYDQTGISTRLKTGLEKGLIAATKIKGGRNRYRLTGAGIDRYRELTEGRA